MIKKISIQLILFLMIPMSSLSSLSPRSYQLDNLLKNQKSKVNIAERQDKGQPPLKNLILLSVKDYHNLNPLEQDQSHFKPKKHWFDSLFYFSKKLHSYRKHNEYIKKLIEKIQEKIQEKLQQQDVSPKEAILAALAALSPFERWSLIIIGMILSPLILSICIASLPGLFFLGLTLFLGPIQPNTEEYKSSISVKIFTMLYVLLLMPIIIALSVLILIPLFLWGTLVAIGFILTFLLDILTFIPRKYFTKKEEKKEEIPQENFLTFLIANQPLATQTEFTDFLQNNLYDFSLTEIQNHSRSAQIPQIPQILMWGIDAFVKRHQGVTNTDNLNLVAGAIKTLLLMNKEEINKSILDLMLILKLLVENKTSQLTDKDRCRMMILHNLLVTLYNAHQMNVFQDKKDIFNFQINVDESLNIPKDKIDPSIWMNKLRKSA